MGHRANQEQGQNQSGNLSNAHNNKHPTSFVPIENLPSRKILMTIVVAALGYFVDIYDLLIFSILRVPSLQSLHVPQEKMLSTGVLLLNIQMAGLLVGGIVWGIWGDKRGRLSVLLGSIFIYSMANIANGFVTSLFTYGALRFVAGIGLAGELGAGITLVSELMPKEIRGLGTAFVAAIGIAGAVFGGFIAEHVTWQHAYFIGGFLGLALLTLRIAVQESTMFRGIQSMSHVKRGNLSELLKKPGCLSKYVRCILIGVPIWFGIGILVTFSPEFGKAFGCLEPVNAGRAVAFLYAGQVVGDFGCGLLSQYLRSRKKVLRIFLLMTLIAMGLFLVLQPRTPKSIYNFCIPLGLAIGYWSMFVTNAAEQFGTNVRATVTTTTPNFVRASVIPLTWFFELAKAQWGVVHGAMVVGLVAIVIALWALHGLEDPFSKDLNYVD